MFKDLKLNTYIWTNSHVAIVVFWNLMQMVHYNSAGLRLNPNLYESGKICLSLLNTWTGTDTEVWNPGASTILQVLLSLQALVLNEKPYFNEAGYDQQIGRAEGEKNSVSYNENAFLVTTKSMMYLLRKPPKVKLLLLFSGFPLLSLCIQWWYRKTRRQFQAISRISYMLTIGLSNKYCTTCQKGVYWNTYPHKHKTLVDHKLDMVHI